MRYNHTYTVILEPDEEAGGYTVIVPALPGCVTEGDTRQEALAAAREAISLHVESLMADGIPVPVETSPIEVERITVSA